MVLLLKSICLDSAPRLFNRKNRPQNLALKMRKKIEFCLVVESEGTANTLVANGFTTRQNCIVMGAQGVPSNAVRGWVKRIQDQLKIPNFLFRRPRRLYGTEYLSHVKSGFRGITDSQF